VTASLAGSRPTDYDYAVKELFLGNGDKPWSEELYELRQQYADEKK
jgi:hypothetical protein